MYVIEDFNQIYTFIQSMSRSAEMRYNGPAVEGVNVGGVSPSGSSPGALATKLSRRASRHGAIFAIPAKDKIVPVKGFVQSRSHGFGR